MNFIISLSPAFIYLAKLCLLLTTVQLVASHLCIDNKCNCLWQSNKLSADCSLQKLTALPKGSESADIQAINLTRNSFPELKRNLFLDSNLVNLQKICLQKVGLERVDEKAFNKLKILIELDMSHNSLKDIPRQSFDSITRLRLLDLSSNVITSVESHSFSNLTNLKILSLERNRIESIDENAFIGLVNLETLKLNENRLTNIRSQSLLPLSRVNSVTLSENKWKCDCALRSVRKYLLANPRINIPDEPKCEDKVWTIMGLDWFICPPVISDYSSSLKPIVSDGSTLKLECAVVLSDEDDPNSLSITWHWRDRPIYNNSKGCGEDCHIQKKNQQYFLITETTLSDRKLKISRLELSSVLSLNSGKYKCLAKNGAGSIDRVFDVRVAAHDAKSKVTVAAASSDKDLPIDEVSSGEEKKSKEEADNVIIGLILGILFGVFLVLILFGILIILLCRRRRSKPAKNRNNFTAEGTEMEKLTTNSNCSVKVNPIQKPPRLTLNSYSSEKDMPEVWLIKHNINGNSNLIRDQTYAESDYSTQLLFNDRYNESQNISDSFIEPDVIHPSAYVRERQPMVTNLDDLDQLSIHSDGTEV